ncbi:MAG: ABC transporter permease [Actinomycetaceae bacterium]|nr:ABC transporter permease [Arcanobacterium sp.]MDD7505743.1 ABC transporter permease [Actinomycetaceae bacterium]MDY6143658.1 ABC transporter permease [Arcanobacterium sp.]
MKTRYWLAPVLLGACILGAWFIFTTAGIIPAYVLPTPQLVFSRLVFGLYQGFLTQALLQTIVEALIGCVLAASIGVPVGLAISHWRPLSASVEPYLAASQAIPAVALAPLLVMWVGYGLVPVVILCTIIVVFPIIIGTAVGVRSIDPDVVGAARLDGAAGLRLVTSIEIPIAAPAILAGLRNGFTLAITGAVVGEMVIGGIHGLGVELIAAQHSNDVPAMFATIVLLALVAVALYLGIRSIENSAIRAVCGD